MQAAEAFHRIAFVRELKNAATAIDEVRNTRSEGAYVDVLDRHEARDVRNEALYGTADIYVCGRSALVDMLGGPQVLKKIVSLRGSGV
jgi:hypothetical protein